MSRQSFRRRSLRIETLEQRRFLSAGPSVALGAFAAAQFDDVFAVTAPKKIVADDFGNTFAQATTVKLYSNGSGSQAGRIDAAYDVDMFRITAPVTGQMSVRQVAASRSPLDSTLYIYDKNQKVLCHDDPNPGPLNSVLQFSVTAGASYYVRAGGFRTSSGAYLLSVATIPTKDDFGNTLDVKPGDKNFMSLTAKGAGTWNGNINYIGDADVFRFMTTVPGHVVIRQVAAAGSRVDPYVYLYDAKGNLVSKNDNFGTSKNSQVAIDVGAGGVYYVKATGAGGGLGKYSVQITTGAALQDDFPDTIPEATEIYLASDGFGTQAGRIDPASDVDMFSVTATMTGNMKIRETAAPGSQLTPYLKVYDASGTCVGSSDGTGKANASVDISGVTAGSTYYVAAASANLTAGAYSIQITAYVPPPPPLPPDGTYNITLNMNITDPAQAAVVQQAAAKWESVVTCDLPNVLYKGSWIDDIRIDFSIVAIDGAGGILGGSYSPDCRPVKAGQLGSGLPYHNVIIFDSADVPTLMQMGEFFAVAEHEMGHGLGVGSLWSSFRLVTGLGSANPRYTGPNAVAEYQAAFNTNLTTVPVEATGGSGTAGVHWRKQDLFTNANVFGSELMTGYLMPADGVNTGHPLSRITVASLMDLGYTVDLSAADAYTAPGSAQIRALDSIADMLARKDRRLLVL